MLQKGPSKMWEFNKEMKLQELLKENIDLELLFIKYLLDREVTDEKMGEYALNYTTLTDDQKWEFAMFYKEELNRNMFMWPDFLLNMEMPMEIFRNNMKLSTLEVIRK